MKVKMYVLVMVSILTILFFGTLSQAEIYRLSFDVLTSTYAQPSGVPRLEINADIIVADSMLRPPDAVQSLKVTAPGGTVFSYSPTSTKLYWSEFNNAFWFGATNNDFADGIIPSGTYKVTSVDKAGKIMSNTEFFTVAFLTAAEITSPTQNQVLTTLTPTIKWTAVPGAEYYRVYLRNESWKEPVYISSPHNLNVYRNYFKIPTGVLMPKTTYSVAIQARDSDSALNKRSRSLWVTFTTP
ncbi:MAG: hypothetical protein AB9866_30785 [Syntrophobacteraceae bacterium]